MQLIVDIDEEDYHKVRDGRCPVSVMHKALYHAMPLTWSMQVMANKVARAENALRELRNEFSELVGDYNIQEIYDKIDDKTWEMMK